MAENRIAPAGLGLGAAVGAADSDAGESARRFRRSLGLVWARSSLAHLRKLRALSGGEARAVSSVSVEGETVDHERVAEEVEELAGVADAVGAAEPEGVFEVAVDRFGVVAPRVQPGEVGVTRRDGPDVLGAVEPPGRVLGVGV